MEDYQINEKDINTVIHYLKIHDPKNADRDYAIQLLESMQGLANEIAHTDGISPELIQQMLEIQDKPD